MAHTQDIQPNVKRIRVSVFGESQTGDHHGFVDNVVFTITGTIPEPSTMIMTLLTVIFAAMALACHRRAS